MPVSISSPQTPQIAKLLIDETLGAAHDHFTQVTISSIYSYIKAEIYWITTTAAPHTLTATLNGDGAGNYDTENLKADTATTSAVRTAADTKIPLGITLGNNGETCFSTLEFINTNVNYKQIFSKFSAVTRTNLCGTIWKNNALVTTLDIVDITANMAIGSRLRVWGYN